MKWLKEKYPNDLKNRLKLNLARQQSIRQKLAASKHDVVDPIWEKRIQATQQALEEVISSAAKATAAAASTAPISAASTNQHGVVRQPVQPEIPDLWVKSWVESRQKAALSVSAETTTATAMPPASDALEASTKSKHADFSKMPNDDFSKYFCDTYLGKDVEAALINVEASLKKNPFLYGDKLVLERQEHLNYLINDFQKIHSELKSIMPEEREKLVKFIDNLFTPDMDRLPPEFPFRHKILHISKVIKIIIKSRNDPSLFQKYKEDIDRMLLEQPRRISLKPSASSAAAPAAGPSATSAASTLSVPAAPSAPSDLPVRKRPNPISTDNRTIPQYPNSK